MSQHPDLGTRWRSATPADGEFLRRLFASTRGAELDGLGADTALKDQFLALQFAARERGYRWAHPEAVCRVVECGPEGSSEAIGQVWVDIGPTRIDLLDISLLPAWRGAGLGGALLNGLLGEARALQRPVHLQVTLGHPAQRLYARLGFIEAGVDGLHLAMHWDPRPSARVQSCKETSDEQA